MEFICWENNKMRGKRQDNNFPSFTFYFRQSTNQRRKPSVCSRCRVVLVVLSLLDIC